MDESTTPLNNSTISADDDAASQSSQRSNLSLLERIRLQRQRESLSSGQQTPQPPTATTPPPSTISMPQQSTSMTTTNNTPSSSEMTPTVPQYNPNAAEQNFAGGGPASHSSSSQQPHELGNSSFFASAWQNIHSSMERGMAALETTTSTSQEARNYDGEQYYSNPSVTIEEEYDDDGGGMDSMRNALLAPSSHAVDDGMDENYSMANYFMTFVKDVYGAFMAVPLIGRIVLVLLLLYVVVKFI